MLNLYNLGLYAVSISIGAALDRRNSCMTETYKPFNNGIRKTLLGKEFENEHSIVVSYTLRERTRTARSEPCTTYLGL